MSARMARRLFDGLRAAVLTVAIGGAVFTMAGGVDGPTNIVGTVQMGSTVQGETPLDSFNPGATLDTTQVTDR